MSKAEIFIQEHTRSCSNQLEWSMKTQDKEVSYFHYWLTPDQARKAVEIAKEEVIEKAIEWIENNFSLYEGISGYYVAKEFK